MVSPELLPKSAKSSILVKLRKEVEYKVRLIARKYEYEASTVRNLAILLGLTILEQILKTRPRRSTLERLYYNLLRGVRIEIEED